MSSSKSLQKTLGIGLTVGVTLLWLAALLSAVLVSQSKLNEILDSALQETAQRILPLAVIEIINSENTGQLQNIMPVEAHDERLVYLVRDNLGTILLQSHNADPTVFNQQLRKGFSSSATYRFYGAFAVQNTVHIEVAEPLILRQEAVFKMALTLLWPSLLLIPLCFIGTWIFVRYSLRHILAYRTEIESRGSGDLSPVRVQGLPIEILPIAESVNDLLLRLRKALESERSFTANSAHELRTPIATALAQIQRLQQEVSAGPIKDRTVKIETSLRTLASLSEKLIQLAKAEGGGLLSTERHDLTSVLRLVVDDLRQSSPASKIELSLPECGTFMSVIDPDAFAILIRNLLDNAIKHGSSKQPVEVSFSSAGVLSIVNAGGVIPAESFARLRQRFARLNTTVQGSGLGLAIVDAIVTGIGATMTFNSPATGREDGFEVRIELPVIKGAGDQSH